MTPEEKAEKARQAVDAGDLEQVVRTHRLRRMADRILDAEERGPITFPHVLTLRERLARTSEPVAWRITDLQKMKQRVVLAAQHKAGKTTVAISLSRALLDGVPFFDTYDVSPVNSLVLLDFEMADDGPNLLDDWYRDADIRNDDRLVVFPLRGRAGSFNILDDDTRARWVEHLRGAEYLILDCLRPVLDAIGLDENHDAGQFFDALDKLLVEAGIKECLVIHHMGHANERPRGDSRILDWPDVVWTLVRADENPSSPRFFKAFGRGVDVGETRLAFNTETKRLAVEGVGSRQAVKVKSAFDDVVQFILKAQTPPSQRQIVEGLKDSGHTRKHVVGAINSGIKHGRIVIVDGPRKAQLHRVVATASSVKQHDFVEVGS
jgi:hypothetical protein